MKNCINVNWRTSLIKSICSPKIELYNKSYLPRVLGIIAPLLARTFNEEYGNLRQSHTSLRSIFHIEWSERIYTETLSPPNWWSFNTELKDFQRETESLSKRKWKSSFSSRSDFQRQPIAFNAERKPTASDRKRWELESHTKGDDVAFISTDWNWTQQPKTT